MVKVEILLNELLNRYNLSINQLHLLTGIRRATLSELASGKRQRVQLEHIEKIAGALEIGDINEIITLRKIDDGYCH
ncbi:helix-turn-helix transcriptional regulator [Virgibacillus sp. NKC19-3]|uniref:helix-turn-helix domain-containing protein n=1 Tax=Virgibacillus saliphilus TaxID=2831674 RepID=UPI001C9B797F|nr:helix-turn-helix transcriptional regulator [Virgibacillus sp. NKC19-3]MBY7144591.1 helix-turn-helix transcriptional regulator [Virgibacillus sp. NKC19-3]